MTRQFNLTAHQDLVHELSQSLDEPEWFLKIRLEAFSLLKELEPPKIERLNYSDWGIWKLPNVNLIENRASRSSTSKQQEDILVIDFNEAISNHSIFQRLYEDSIFNDSKDLFDAFHTAFLTSGQFIYVPKGVQVNTPIETEFLVDEKAKDQLNHQVFIYVEANASVEIIEKYYSISEKQKQRNLNAHIHIQAQAGSNIKYTAIDQLDKNVTAFFRRTGETQKDATLNIALSTMNDGNTIEDVQVDLIGEGSSADVKLVAISHGTQTQCANTNVTNYGKHTVGNIYQHGVVLEEATLIFNGIGNVLKNSKYSDAQQESRILMLSDEARADTNPILLIDEYELTAGHAASVSRVDETQLYYLMSRGLDRKRSEKLVIRGFLGSVLSAISIKDIREKLVETIERKLNAL